MATASWHRRAGWWIALAVVVVVGVFVAADVTTPSSAADRRASLSSYLSIVAGDVAQCSAGTHDAVIAWTRSLASGVGLGTAKTFTTQAIAVCSFENSGVVALGTTIPARNLPPVAARIGSGADAWAYLGAFDLLQAMRVAEGAPGVRGDRLAVVRAAAAADSRRRGVEALVVEAERADGSPHRSLPLVQVTPLLPNGVGGAA